ncbi:MAG: hypothetical protein WAU58_12825 [Terriglobales bacterium]|jgi:hypothetical protein
MVDRTKRLEAAGLIEKFAAREVTNFEFEDRFPRSADPALHAVHTVMWSAYSDIREHRLDGTHALKQEARDVFERCALFLRTDTEYTGIRSFVTFAAPFKRIWSRILGRNDPVMSASWPFDTAEELERAQKGDGRF